MRHRGRAHRAANDGAPYELRRSLDANVNGMRMHNRVIVYVRVYGSSRGSTSYGDGTHIRV